MPPWQYFHRFVYPAASALSFLLKYNKMSQINTLCRLTRNA